MSSESEWRVVKTWPPDNNVDDGFSRLSTALEQTQTAMTRLSAGQRGRAMAVSCDALAAAGESRSGLTVEGDLTESVANDAQALFFSREVEAGAVEELVSTSAMSESQRQRATLVGIQTGNAGESVRQTLRNLGVEFAEPVATLTVVPRAGAPSSFELYRLPAEIPGSLSEGAPKIGEGPKNLRQRQDWFKRRTEERGNRGGSPK